MNNATVTPTAVAQRLEVQETFFSTTDARGVILDGNGVFARVSGYPLEQMLGRNHNLIRHPGVPRGVFHLMWESLRAGETFMGYVLNLAANANHYWVMAVVMPVADGYLSVRIKPTSERLQQVAALYAQVLARENALVAEGSSEGAAAAQGAQWLAEGLAAAGWPDYAGFSHESLILEIRQRDAQVAAGGRQLFPASLPATAPESLRGLHAKALATYRQLNQVFDRLDTILRGSAKINRHREAVAAIGDAFQLNALNAHLAAHPLGTAGVVIGTVAGFLNTHARQLNENMARLTAHIAESARGVSDIASTVCAARVQMEMILSFAGEMMAAETGAGAADRSLGRVAKLQEACRASTEGTSRAIEAMLVGLPLLRQDRERLRKDMVALQSTQVTGITEAARLEMAAELQGMFVEMRRQVDRTKAELDGLGDSIDELIGLTQDLPAAMQALMALIDELDGNRQVRVA